MEFNNLTLQELADWLNNPANQHACVLGTDNYQAEATTGCYRCLAALCVRELQPIPATFHEIDVVHTQAHSVKSPSRKNRRKKCPTS
jgi:hypothetical protein